MSTSVMTLRGYADTLQELADEWGDNQPAVLIGDVHGNLSVTEKDGYTEHGCVNYATEIFDGNGVLELGENTDRRFYGTMLIDADDLNDTAREQLGSEGGDD